MIILRSNLGIVSQTRTMEISGYEGKIFHQIFLDLSKVSDTIDRKRLALLLHDYGLGPRGLAMLEATWTDSSLGP